MRDATLFTVRIWRERLSDERAEWRGKVEHVISGETRYFRDWSALHAFFERMSPPEDSDVPASDTDSD